MKKILALMMLLASMLSMADDTAWINETILHYPDPVVIRCRFYDYEIDWSQIATQGKTVMFCNAGGATINGGTFSDFYYRDPGNGAAVNMCDPADGTRVINKYQAICNFENAGDGRAYGYYFDLRSDGYNEEAVRGLVGNVINTGTGGAFKAVRVGAIDQGTASALMAFCGSISPNSTTQNAYAMQLSDHGSVDDKATYLLLDGYNRVKNGIEFKQGVEVLGSWIQASMGPGSGTSSRFLKLKDSNGVELFIVDRFGRVVAVAGVVGGTENNGTELAVDGVHRTHPNGNIVVSSGENGEVFIMRGDVVIAKINAENELEVTSGKIRLGNTLLTEAMFQ